MLRWDFTLENDELCIQMMDFSLENDELCIQMIDFSLENDELCIQMMNFSLENDELCIQMMNFALENDGFCIQMMDFVGTTRRVLPEPAQCAMYPDRRNPGLLLDRTSVWRAQVLETVEVLVCCQPL